MKLSVAVAAKTALPSAFVVWRDFEASIEKAAGFGYHGVELALKKADDVNPSLLAGWLGRAGLEVSCITTGQVFAALGLYFTHPDDQKRREVTAVFEELILLAKEFGGMVNIGRARGFYDENTPRAETRARFVETAGPIAAFAQKHGVRLVLEPVNRYESNFVNTLDEGAQLLANLPGMGLMPDTFHMNIEEANIGENLRRHAPLVQYIHFADSNRHAPGEGHLCFEEVFAALGDIGYDNWACVEILPVPDPDTAARKAAETLLPMVARHSCF